MKKMKVLWRVMKQTRASEILLSYLVFVCVDAFFIFLIDPAIHSYGNALWYCCAVIFTAGFGDLVATVVLSKIATVILMIYSVIVVAIVTGVIVNFYSQLIRIRQENTLEALIEKLEKLPELSKEELEELSLSVKRIRK